MEKLRETCTDTVPENTKSLVDSPRDQVARLCAKGTYVLKVFVQPNDFSYWLKANKIESSDSSVCGRWKCQVQTRPGHITPRRYANKMWKLTTTLTWHVWTLYHKGGFNPQIAKK